MKPLDTHGKAPKPQEIPALLAPKRTAKKFVTGVTMPGRIPRAQTGVPDDRRQVAVAEGRALHSSALNSLVARARGGGVADR